MKPTRRHENSASMNAFVSLPGKKSWLVLLLFIIEISNS
jgi:hypothetical protein